MDIFYILLDFKFKGKAIIFAIIPHEK